MAIELAEATEIHKNAMKQKTLMVDEQVWQWLKQNRGAGSISDLIQELIDCKEGSKKTEKSDMQVANQDIQIMTVEAENARVGAEKARTDLEAIVERDKTLEHESKKTNLNIQKAFAIKWRNKREQTNLKKELEKSALDSWIIDCLIFSDKIRNRSLIRLEGWLYLLCLYFYPGIYRL